MKIIRNIQIALALLFLTTCSVTCIDYKSIRDKIEIVNITAKENIPIIKINVSGQDYVFLIDTNSPISFIDSAVVSKYNLKQTKVQVQEYRLVTGDGVKLTKCVSIMDNIFYIHNFKRTKNNVQWHTGLSIDGIIGNDMLHNNRATLDLKKVITDKIKENQ